MAVRNYEPHVCLGSEYAPLIKKGVALHLQCSIGDFPSKRLLGLKNIDLWVDGSLYPVNPITGVTPPFRNLKTLLEFLCHGEAGLLGYTQSLARVWLDEIERLKEALTQLNVNHVIERERFQLEHQNLVDKLEETELLVSANGRLHAEKLLEVGQIHQAELDGVEAELRSSKGRVNFLQRKLSSVKQAQSFKIASEKHRTALDSLQPKSGYAKRRVMQIRSLLNPRTVVETQSDNRATQKRKRVWGDAESQAANAAALARFLSRREADALVRSPRLAHVTTQIANDTIKRIELSVTPEHMLAACDATRVSGRGYSEIYKTSKNRIGLLDPKLRGCTLPNPHKLSLLRRELNGKLKDFIGDFEHIVNYLEVPDPEDKSKAFKYVLNEKNNIFADIEAVQRSMINLYGVTVDEIGDNPLIFVLKLDEAEIVKGKKYERVSLTLMNRALDPSVISDDEKYFSVQSEQEVWPIGCFEVMKESHATLKWVFEQTRWPAIISAQEEGQELVVNDVGSFKVQWHLSADMKTIKCMYGLKHGAHCQFSCIFCMQEHVFPKTVSKNVALRLAKNRSKTWEGGLFSRKCEEEPVPIEFHDRWQPILPIPLTRVHICTLHALVRVIEKILHLHFMFVWNMSNTHAREEAIDRMEKSLSAVGVHGGHVCIVKDLKRSGANNSVAAKPSLNGATAMKFFKESPWSGQDKVWKDVVRSENNQVGNGAGYLARMEMWQAFDDVIPYLTGLVFKEDQSAVDFKTKVHKWGKLFLKCFGEEHVTHYVHVLVKHAPWFVEKYGSLSVWSCQGMEKSHYAAKAAYQAHTQHGGTKKHTSAIVQLYEHWYRNIQHRFAKKQERAELLAQPVDTVHIARVECRRAASNSPSAIEGRRRWLAQRVRVGRVWKLRRTSIEGLQVPEDNGGIEAVVSESG